MRTPKCLITRTLLAVCAVWAPLASALVIGQSDTFEDGTTMNWGAALLGATHPTPPVNIPNGGPLGVGDNYLALTSVGGSGAGSRLTGINLSQWAGDYTAAGVTVISMDLINPGSTDLSIRLYFENPNAGPPTDTATTSANVLLAGAGWTHVEFAIAASDLIGLTGDVGALLSNVTALRIFHGLADAFPGPPVIATLGVDNITARGVHAVPEPSALSLFMVALLGLFGSTTVQRRSATR